MNSEFYIASSVKKFIISLDSIIINVPNKEKYFKEQIYINSNNLLEYIYLANYQNTDNRSEYQKLILTKISMLDFYFEYLFTKKYISQKVCKKYCNQLLNIRKMIFKWIKKDE